MTKQVTRVFNKALKQLQATKADLLNYKVDWGHASNRFNHIDQARVNSLTGINMAIQEIEEVKKLYGF